MYVVVVVVVVMVCMCVRWGVEGVVYRGVTYLQIWVKRWRDVCMCVFVCGFG